MIAPMGNTVSHKQRAYGGYRGQRLEIVVAQRDRAPLFDDLGDDNLAETIPVGDRLGARIWSNRARRRIESLVQHGNHHVHAGNTRCEIPAGLGLGVTRIAETPREQGPDRADRRKIFQIVVAQREIEALFDDLGDDDLPQTVPVCHRLGTRIFSERVGRRIQGFGDGF